MIPIIIESPYYSPDEEILLRNIEYARAAMRDSISRGEAPFVSHLLYPQVLGEITDRHVGFERAAYWYPFAKYIVVYEDHGYSSGMYQGILLARKLKKLIKRRKLYEIHK